MAEQFDPFETNALYDAHLPRWQLEEDAAEGFTLDVLDSGRYLKQFSKEDPGDYEYRKFMSCPLDLCRDGVGIRVENLFRTSPVRDYETSPHKAIIERLLADADTDGTPLDTFMRRAVTRRFTTGGEIVTQMTAADGPVMTKADEAAKNIRPYFTLFSPQERYDWAVNGAGSFLWARYSLGREPRMDEQDGESDAERFLTVSVSGWVMWEAVKEDDGKSIKVEKLGEGTHPLGRAPIIKNYTTESTKHRGIPLSLLTRPAVIARAMLNIKGQADADLLAAVTRWVLSGANPGDEDIDQFGPAILIKLLDPNAKIEVIQGSVEHIREKREWLTLYVGEILRLLKFRGGMAETNANSGSGLKLRIERTDLENELRDTAHSLEAMELEMVRQAVVMATGKQIAPEDAAEALGYSVAYNTDYTLEPVGQILEDISVWLSRCGDAADAAPSITKEMIYRLGGALVREDSPVAEQIQVELEEADLIGRTEPSTERTMQGAPEAE